MPEKVNVKVAQSCPTLCDPMDYTDHGILQARILEWVAYPFLQQMVLTQESNWGLLHCRWILYQLSYQVSVCVCVCVSGSLYCTPETNTIL